MRRPMRGKHLLFSLWLLGFLLVRGNLARNVKTLLAVLPLTDETEHTQEQEMALSPKQQQLGGALPQPSSLSLSPSSSSNRTDTHLPRGLSHAAAVLLALDDFAAGNPRLVPELAEVGDCSIQWQVAVADSQSTAAGATRAVLNHLQKDWTAAMAQNDTTSRLDAMVGGSYYGGGPALAVSQLAEALQVPAVLYDAGWSSKMEKLQFTSRMLPDSISGQRVLEFFRDVWGISSLSILLPGTSPVARKLERSLWKQVETEEVDVMEPDDARFRFSTVAYNVDDDTNLVRSLEQLAMGRSRVVLWVVDDWKQEVPTMAQAAAALGRNDLVWVLVSSDGGLVEYLSDPSLDEDVKQLLEGSVVIVPVESYQGDDEHPFHAVWKSVWSDDDFVRRLDELLHLDDLPPLLLSSGEPLLPAAGTGFCYDAVMSILLGACAAQEPTAALNGTAAFSSAQHSEALRHTTFIGTSGTVRFSSTFLGARDGDTMTYAAYNLRQSSDGDETSELIPVLAAIRTPDDDASAEISRWSMIAPFIFAYGSTELPVTTESAVEMNYLSPSIRAVGLSLFAIAEGIILLAAAWVWCFRTTRIVRAAQPFFLYTLLFGSALVSVAIVTNSFDESYGWSVEQLSRACTASPWMVVCGIELIYSALFCKLWRLNQVLQFRRAKVSVRSVVWPVLVVFIANLVLLVAWTITDGFYWFRGVIDVTTGETQACCVGENTKAWFTPIVILIAVPIVLCVYMAWKTKDVDSDYSETTWLFALVAFQLQILLISVPLIFLVADKSTDIRYLGQSIIFFLFSISSVGFIIGPKVVKCHFSDHSDSGYRSHLGKSIVKISGLSENQNPNSTTEHNSGSHVLDDSGRPNRVVRFSTQEVSGLGSSTVSEADPSHSGHPEQSTT